MCKTLERIKQFIDYKGLNISAFEKSVGMSNASFGKSLKNKGAIGTDKLENILRTYPELSPAWLLTGRGEMLLQPDNPNDETPQTSETRPRIPFTAAAGALSIVTGAADEGDCERFPVIHTFPDYDFTIIIEGDSMAPDYLSGDELACAFLNSPADIQWGKPYILDTADGVVFKRIYDGGDSIMCTSINPAGPSFIVNKQELLHIASVVGYIRHT